MSKVKTERSPENTWCLRSFYQFLSVPWGHVKKIYVIESHMTCKWLASVVSVAMTISKLCIVHLWIVRILASQQLRSARNRQDTELETKWRWADWYLETLDDSIQSDFHILALNVKVKKPVGCTSSAFVGCGAVRSKGHGVRIEILPARGEGSQGGASEAEPADRCGSLTWMKALGRRKERKLNNI